MIPPDDELEIRLVTTPAEMAVVVEIRRSVFGDEQQILLPRYRDPEDEFSFNVLACWNRRPAGTGRLSPPGERSVVAAITWVATLPVFRQRGIAHAIMAALIEEADVRRYEAVFLNSQVHANRLYEAFGFRPVGQQQIIHGIPHQAMIRKNPGFGKT